MRLHIFQNIVERTEAWWSNMLHSTAKIEELLTIFCIIFPTGTRQIASISIHAQLEDSGRHPATIGTKVALACSQSVRSMRRLSVFVPSRVCITVILLSAVLGLAGCSRTPKDLRYLESGKQFLEKKDYARAVLQFRNAVQANPKNFEAHYQLALAELGRGDRIAAYRSLTRALDLNPKHTGAQLLIAELLLTSSNAAEVKQGQERAHAVLDASPNNPDAMDAMALAELRLGNRDQALELLEQASSKAPEHLQTAVVLAVSRLSQRIHPGRKAAAGRREDARLFRGAPRPGGFLFDGWKDSGVRTATRRGPAKRSEQRLGSF
jgi:cytochrome c-type biogenesis protein CcmH/NrfG